MAHRLPNETTSRLRRALVVQSRRYELQVSRVAVSRWSRDRKAFGILFGLARGLRLRRIIIGMGAVREKTCESCGKAFECQAGGCWCDDVKLNGATRIALGLRYVDCLCPTCLKAAADGLLGFGADPEQSDADSAPAP